PKEDRVRRVIEPLIGAERTELQFPLDDLQYSEDLGLITRKPHIHISNRIYREVIPRELVSVTQDTMVQESQWYQTKDHRLEMGKLLRAFQQFFRENSESWIERFEYKEAGPQLLLQAFLQRILNSGGRLHREYGLGRKRTDLLIEWPIDPEKGMYGVVQRIVLELKIQRGKLETQLPAALSQTLAYADAAGANEAHLIFFNRDKDVQWEDKIWHRLEPWGERTVDVWGC
ncbi:MAG: ATP-binding protein, partial [Desulfamplus sp.]|nr:ATP-binding protein [Desulfamplus sp.]